MLRKTLLAVAIALGTCAGVQLVVGTASAVAAEEKDDKKKKPGVSAKVAKPLKAAQEAMKQEQWDEALAKTREAQAIPERTPFDDYQINEFLFFSSIKKSDYVTAAQSLEVVVNSEFIPEDIKVERTRQLAQLQFQNKDYKKAIEYGNRWLEMSGGNSASAFELIGQAQYLADDNQAAIVTLLKAVEASKQAGEPVKEQWLQVMLSAYDRMSDTDGVSKTLELLVEHAPTEKYWEDLLTTVYQVPDNDDRTVLEIHRLRHELGLLKRADDYVEMADIAAAVGIPNEAVKALEKAQAAPDAQAKDKERRAGRLTELKRLADSDRKSLPGLEKEAVTAAGGEYDYALGVGYLSFDQYDQAAAALKRAVQKGKLKRPDEAQIMLGRSLLKANQKEEAKQAFQGVPATSKLARIARLWAIYANQA